jgi:biopolymer transport protein ExbD
MRTSRRQRRRKKRDREGVELNLAAMLDMAFQLLTFFILTFRPAPIEGQLALNLPPPVPLTNISTEPNSGDGIGDVLAMETLHLHVIANDRGDVSELKVEATPLLKGSFDQANAHHLDRKLQSLFSVQQIPFDRIQIAVDGKLRYGELMKIIDVCQRQKLPDGTPMKRISFTEIGTVGTVPP